MGTVACGTCIRASVSGQSDTSSVGCKTSLEIVCHTASRTSSFVQFSSEDIVPAQDPELKIVSYNVGRFALQDAKAGVADRKQCADSIFAFLRGQEADIVCLQEFRTSDMDKLRSYLRGQMKGYRAEFYMFPMADGSAFGNVTLSRIPVKGKGKIKFDESANLAIYTDYEMQGRRFRVYNCHFESYNISLPGILRRIFSADKTILSETGIKMKRSITRRPRQVDMVFSDIENCPVEAFVCGDFNDNPMSGGWTRIRSYIRPYVASAQNRLYTPS